MKNDKFIDVYLSMIVDENKINNIDNENIIEEEFDVSKFKRSTLRKKIDIKVLCEDNFFSKVKDSDKRLDAIECCKGLVDELKQSLSQIKSVNDLVNGEFFKDAVVKFNDKVSNDEYEFLDADSGEEEEPEDDEAKNGENTEGEKNGEKSTDSSKPEEEKKEETKPADSSNQTDSSKPKEEKKEETKPEPADSSKPTDSSKPKEEKKEETKPEEDKNIKDAAIKVDGEEKAKQPLKLKSDGKDLNISVSSQNND